MEKSCNGKNCNSLSLSSNLGGTKARSISSSALLCKPDDLLQDSSDEEIPSYQVPQTSKRYSDKSDDVDSILPFSPVLTPPSIVKWNDFLPPPVYTIDTFSKKDTLVQYNLDKSLISSTYRHEEQESVFKTLGMVDKDISWLTSMETPAPHSLSLRNFNTVEKATLLPEDDLKNIQPRALFLCSPTEDVDCKPLKYSSESEDNGNSIDLPTCQVNNLCDTIEHMNLINLMKGESSMLRGKYEFQPVNQSENKPEKSSISSHSPVFKTQFNFKRFKKKKVKPLSNESSVSCSGNTIVMGKKFFNEIDKLESKEELIQLQSNSLTTDPSVTGYSQKHSSVLQDDSLQNFSFSILDDICKSCENFKNTTEHNSMKALSNIKSICAQNLGTNTSNECCGTKSEMSEQIERGCKYFYDSNCKVNQIQQLSSVDGFLETASLFEEGSILDGKHLDRTQCYTHVETFNKFNREISEENNVYCGRSKEIRPQFIGETSPVSKSKKKIFNMDNAELKMQKTEKAGKKSLDHVIGNGAILCSSMDGAGNSNRQKSVENNFACNMDQNTDDYRSVYSTDKGITNEMCISTFFTAHGKSVHVNSKSINRIRKFLGEDFNESCGTFFDIHERKSLNESMKLSNDPYCANSELDDDVNGSSKFNINSELEARKNVNSYPIFHTALGKTVSVSSAAIQAVKVMLGEDFKENSWEGFVPADLENSKDNTRGAQCKPSVEKSWRESTSDSSSPKNDMSKFSAISLAKKESEPNLVIKKGSSSLKKKSSDDVIEDSKIFHGFTTASGSAVKISSESLTKVKKIFRDIEIDLGENSTTENTKDKINYKVISNMISSDLFKEKAPINQVKMSEESLQTTRACPVNDINKGTYAKNVEIPNSTEDKKTSENDSAGSFDMKQKNSIENLNILPNWMHTYTTSPTLTMDRMNLVAFSSHEDCRNQSTPRDQYITKSPNFGSTDRFQGIRKAKNHGRKLNFGELKTLGESKFLPHYESKNTNFSCKRSLNELSTDFALPFKKQRLEEKTEELKAHNFIKINDEVVEGRNAAKLEQIGARRKGNVEPLVGSHYLRKKETQKAWIEAVGGCFPKRFSKDALMKYGVREDVLNVNVYNAGSYRFTASDFYTSSDCSRNVNGFPLGDGCSLIFDENNTAGMGDFTRAFFASPGVQPNLITEKWVENHYKWIVWKFSHYERSFPQFFAGRCLTPHNVMLQLKYRYDREIDRSHRSSLKKILEKDDSAARRIVLCVCDIKKACDVSSNNEDSASGINDMPYTLGLTDGWYSCYAQTDSAMLPFIENRKITIGTKLITQGAELINCDEGLSPLEASHNVHLKISTNSTRRAKWDTKLGFQRNSGPILIPLNSVLSHGGHIGRLNVIIVRMYPVLFMERKSDGTNVIRNRRLEDKEAAAFQTHQESLMEQIYLQAKEEIEDQERQKKKQRKKPYLPKLKEVVDPEELYKLLDYCSDPASLQSELSKEQLNILMKHQQKQVLLRSKALSELVEEKIKMKKMNERKVSQLLKLKVVDVRDLKFRCPTMFTVWNATEDVLTFLTEGKSIALFNVTSNNSKSTKYPHLYSTRETHYELLKSSVDYPARKPTSLRELQNNYDFIFNEIDFVAMVVLIEEASCGSKLSQTVFMTDFELNFVGVVFWGHCKDLGWENVLTVNSVVACSNVQCSKSRNSQNIPLVYVNDTTVFTENPKHSYLKEEINRFKGSLPQDIKKFIEHCEKEIHAKLFEQRQLSGRSKQSIQLMLNHSSPNENSFFKPRYRNTFNGPKAFSTPLKPTSPGLEISGQEPSPIQKRTEMLKSYGESPPLSPLLPLDQLEKFRTKFRVPFKGVSQSNYILK